MKNIIIFGGAGFIGTNLTKKLLNQGHKILCIDNFYTSKKQNVDQFLGFSNYYFFYGDVTVNIWEELNNIIKKFLNDYVDEIYNLACPASPPKYQINPLYTVHCSLAIEYICDLAIKYNAKLLHASTSEVYGDPLVHPQTEEYKGNVNTFGPRACYDEGKRIAETIIYEYSKCGCKVKVIRIFNTYGPYMDPNDGRVISNFICQAIQNKPITIYGDGSQTRSFQYIDDLLNGIEAMMNTEDEFTGPVNIGTDFEFTILELAKMVIKYTNSKSKLIFEDLPIDDPMQRKANINKLKNKTEWQPNITLDYGLKETISYFKNELIL